MKRSTMYRFLSLFLVMLLTLPMFPVRAKADSTMDIWREAPSGFDEDTDVDYGDDGGFISNWGVRGEHATFLTSPAENYYTGSYTYENLSAFEGEYNINMTPSSELFQQLSAMMNAKSTWVTTYSDSRDLFKFTDCMVGDDSHISSFYSSAKLNGEWDSAQTWNREHVWPNSKIDDDGENDIMMLRPTSVQENSDRGNMAYGESSGFYDPNTESKDEFNLHGDCARILLYTYVRWGVTDTMWGESGVIENLDVLLKWMKEDPVDTWEMGRNDSVESMIGVRNVFVDYPEFAWLLFNREVPAHYVSPSSVSPGSGHTYNAVVTKPTCTENGYTTYTCAACDSTLIADETDPLGHKDADHNGKCDVCGEDMPAESIKFTLYTGELQEGDYMIVYNGKALQASSTASAKRLDYDEVTEGDSIDCDNVATIFHIAQDGDYWTISSADTGLYVGGTGVKNVANMMEGGTDNTLWTAVMTDGKFEFINKKNTDEGVNNYLRSNGDLGWACYSTNTGGPLTLYSMVEDTPQTYTVTWLNADGTLLEKDENVESGTIPSYDGETPTKESDGEYTYTFAGWDQDTSVEVTDDVTFIAVFDAEKIEQETSLESYTVTWLNTDGTLLEKDENVAAGTIPSYDGETPTKEADAEYIYTFAGWNQDTSAEVTSDITFIAVYDTEKNEEELPSGSYTVTWLNTDGTLLEKDENVEAGTIPSYDGETPTKEADSEYIYTFTGWNQDTSAEVKSDITFIAVYDTEKNEEELPAESYTVTWVDADGTVLETDENVESGSIPSYDGETPSKEPDAVNTYTFAGWDKDTGAEVTCNITFIATYESTAGESDSLVFTLYSDALEEDDYLIVYNGKALEADYQDKNKKRLANDEVTEGDYILCDNDAIIFHIAQDGDFWTIYSADTGLYVGGTGVKNVANLMEGGTDSTLWTVEMADGKFDFINKMNEEAEVNSHLRNNGDNGWACYADTMGGALTLYRLGEMPAQDYTVIWMNDDGTVLETDENVESGSTPSYDGETPSKEPDAKYSYSFSGWNLDTSEEVTGDMTFIATFDAEPLSQTEPPVQTYTVTWVNADGTVLETDENVESGTIPSYDGKTPDKEADAQNTYTFAGWDKDINTEVTNDIAFIAMFDAEPLSQTEPSVQTYTVTWVNADGTVLETDENVEKGSIPSYDGKTPAKASDDWNTYTFTGWDKDISAEVTNDISFIAMYDAERIENGQTVEKYPVEISDNITNGRVAAVSTAAPGEKVTLTVIPDTGYELKSLTVTDAEGNELTVTDNSFIMPDSKVTINAVFSKIADEQEKEEGKTEDKEEESEEKEEKTEKPDTAKGGGHKTAPAAEAAEPSVTVKTAEASVSGNGPEDLKEALKQSVYSYEGMNTPEAISDIIETLNIPADRQDKIKEVVIEKYLQISVIEVVEDDDLIVLKTDITPMKRYTVTYTDDSDPTESSPIEDETGSTVKVTLSVGKAFTDALTSSTVHVNHKNQYQYDGEAADGLLTFTTTHGFSYFEITASIASDDSDADKKASNDNSGGSKKSQKKNTSSKGSDNKKGGANTSDDSNAALWLTAAALALLAMGALLKLRRRP